MSPAIREHLLNAKYRALHVYYLSQSLQQPCEVVLLSPCLAEEIGAYRVQDTELVKRQRLNINADMPTPKARALKHYAILVIWFYVGTDDSGSCLHTKLVVLISDKRVSVLFAALNSCRAKITRQGTRRDKSYAVTKSQSSYHIRILGQMNGWQCEPMAWTSRATEISGSQTLVGLRIPWEMCHTAQFAGSRPQSL